MSSLVLLTGRPGIGKTSVLLRAVNVLKNSGLKVGGMISREAREGGIRVGFRIVDLDTGREGWLAHVNEQSGPRVGKYRVNLRDLKTVGVKSILTAMIRADIVVVDEIGPMELSSSEFKEAVMKVVKSNKPMVGIIHHKAHDTLIHTIKTTHKTDILEVTFENRHILHEKIVGKIVRIARKA